MHNATWVMLLVGGLMGGITTNASSALATPSTGHVHETKEEAQNPLWRLSKAPKDESIARASWIGKDAEQRVEPGSERASIVVGKKRFWIELAGDPKAQRLEVRDGQRLLYGLDQDAPSFAFGFHGARVLFAGRPDNGTFAYDLTTGKKLASVQDLVFSPKGHFALSPPPFEDTGCANRSRVFRIPLDGSAKPYSIDTSPLRREVLCTEDGALPKGNFAERAAISPKGDVYAVLSRDELALFSAKTDKKIARFESPPYDEREGGHNSVAFSSSGNYLVVTHARRESGETERSWFSWTTKKHRK